MMIRNRRIIFALGCMLVSFCACRSTPPSPSLPPEPPREQQAQEPVPTPEEAKPPAPAIPAPKPGIARVLPESLIAAPERDSASPRVDYSAVLHIREIKNVRNGFWRYRMTRPAGKLVGFEFSNSGGNRILPPRRDAVKNQFFTRDFQFSFGDRARQDIHLLVSDWPPSRDRTFRLSELMNRLMLFFPRTYLPAIVNIENRNLVTLPTGEEVEFEAATHEILSGVFAEAPVDLNPDGAARQFPSVEYRGKGVSVRADARGKDPRMATTAVITTGSPPEQCGDRIACNRCEVKPQELWEQSGAARFKFPTDESFDQFLRARCGFGIPKLAGDLVSVKATATLR